MPRESWFVKRPRSPEVVRRWSVSGGRAACLGAHSLQHPLLLSVLVGFNASDYKGDAVDGDRVYQVICEQFPGVLTSSCIWSGELQGSHIFEATAAEGQVLAGMRSYRLIETRRWRYRTCTISCDSMHGYQPVTETACQGRLPVGGVHGAPLTYFPLID